MQNQEIQIEILPDGRIEYTIKGVKGSACDSISELLERLGSVEAAEHTGEYYEYGQEASVAIQHG